MPELAFLKQFTIAGAGVWTLVGLVALGLIKTWPILAKQAIEAKAQLRKEKREDLSECHQRMDEMNKRLDEMTTAFNNLKIELSATLSAYRILDAEVEQLNPTSLGLLQARAILSTAFTIAPSTIPTAEVKP